MSNNKIGSDNLYNSVYDYEMDIEALIDSIRDVRMFTDAGQDVKDEILNKLYTI